MRIISPSAAQLKHQRILLRLDLNMPLAGGRISDDFKLQAALPLIRSLSRRSAVIIMTHVGEPKAKREFQSFPALSVRPIAARLKKIFGKNFLFIESGSWPVLRRHAAALQPGTVMLIENLRFWKGETKNSSVFAKHLADLGDIYINDAFAVSHRAHASVSAIKKFLPAYAGKLLAAEVRTLERIRRGRQPLVMVLGGAKISSKLPLIKAFLKKAAAILVGGDLANELLEDRRGLSSTKVIIPVAGGRRLQDIDSATAVRFAEIISRAKTVFWNGPMGIFEKPSTRIGTSKVITAMATAKRHGGFVVAGGGETIAAIRMLKKASSFSALSTGGGASLAFLAGEPMPGLTGIIVF